MEGEVGTLYERLDGVVGFLKGCIRADKKFTSWSRKIFINESRITAHIHQLYNFIHHMFKYPRT